MEKFFPFKPNFSQFGTMVCINLLGEVESGRFRLPMKWIAMVVLYYSKRGSLGCIHSFLANHRQVSGMWLGQAPSAGFSLKEDTCG